MADRQHSSGQNAEDEGPAKNANEARLEEAVRSAEARSAEDHAALERIRRKLMRLMLVSLAITFIALAIVGAAIIYKIAHTPLRKTAAAGQNSPLAQNEAAVSAGAPAAGGASEGGLFIQTAPNSGAENYFADEKQRQEEDKTAAAAAALEQRIRLKTGEKLLEARLSDNLLLLRISAGGEAENTAKLIIYDFRQGKILAAIKIGG